jgi:hypothetical protein
MFRRGKQLISLGFVTILLLILLSINIYICITDRPPHLSKQPNAAFFTFTKSANDPTSLIPDLILLVLEQREYDHTKSLEKASFVFPYKLDQLDDLTPFLSSMKYGTWIYGLQRINYIANKATFAQTLKQYYTTDMVDTLVPRTWILSHTTDVLDLTLTQFHTDGRPIKPMLMKSNKQRQQGIFFVEHIRDITTNPHACVVCQDLLQNPYLVNKKKINCRVYVLVLCKNNEVQFYMYGDGFMYYAPMDFHSDSASMSEKYITSGLLPRSIYDGNPLTVSDFKKTLTKEESSSFTKKTLDLLKKVFLPFQQMLLRHEYVFTQATASSKNIGSFVLMGCDISPDEHLNPLIMEINKGPDLSPKDERDKKLKRSMINDMISLLHMQHTKHPNGFIKFI